MTLSLSVGARCHHLAASGGWLGARWVSPRYLLGVTLGITDMLTGAHTRKGRTHTVQRHRLPAQSLLCIKWHFSSFSWNEFCLVSVGLYGSLETNVDPCFLCKYDYMQSEFGTQMKMNKSTILRSYRNSATLVMPQKIEYQHFCP